MRCQGGLISSESWKGLAFQVSQAPWLNGATKLVWLSLAWSGHSARGLVRISQAVKDAHLALPPASWPGACTLSREHFWLNSIHTLLGTKYLTLLFWLQLPLVQMWRVILKQHTWVRSILYGSLTSVHNIKQWKNYGWSLFGGGVVKETKSYSMNFHLYSVPLWSAWIIHTGQWSDNVWDRKSVV